MTRCHSCLRGVLRPVAKLVQRKERLLQERLGASALLYMDICFRFLGVAFFPRACVKAEANRRKKYVQ